MTARNSAQFLPASGVYFPGAYASMVSALSVAEKQKILYRAAQGLDGGQGVLESWTRKDLLELICLEMGKERKYTGVSKGKMIEQLMKLVSKKGVGEVARNRGGDDERANGDGNGDGIQEVSSEGRVKKHRKVGRPARVPAMDNMARETSPALSPAPSIDTDMASVQVVEAPASTVCRNTACKALLLPGESFCIRCSCFICRTFDDNKDPSLWIFCTPEPGLSSVDCRLSCHIECALKDGIAGVGQVAAAASSSHVSSPQPDLDASFRCPSCGKHSCLIGCCKKQLSVAKDARRVDLLCQRLSLCRRLLAGTRKHKEFHELVEKAIQKLEDEIGPVMEGSSKFVRGLVNRLSSSREVLKLIRCALEASDAVHEAEAEAERQSTIAPSVDEDAEKSSDLPSVVEEKRSCDICTIEFEKVTSSSIVVSVKGGGELATGYRVWHRRATAEASYPNNPTCIISSNPGEAQIADLQPSTDYCFYVVPFSARGIGEPSEALCQTLKHEVAEHGALSQDREEGRAVMDGCGPSDFKVRALGKMVGGEGRDPLEAMREIFQGSRWGRDSESALDEDGAATLAGGGAVLTQAAEESGITASQTTQANNNAASIEGGSVNVTSESWAVQVRTMPSPTTTVSASATDLILTQKRRGPLLCASRNYEMCVRIVRWLECQGHLAEDFRMKFLTWLSLHASEHEKRVVGVFIDALQDDPPSLAAQLVHTFSDAVSSKHRLPCNAFRHEPSWR